MTHKIVNGPTFKIANIELKRHLKINLFKINVNWWWDYYSKWWKKSDAQERLFDVLKYTPTKQS